MVVANQPDIVVVEKQDKNVLMIDVAITSNSNIKHEKLEKIHGLKEELDQMWIVKASVVPVVIGALGGVTLSLERGSNKSKE